MGQLEPLNLESADLLAAALAVHTAQKTRLNGNSVVSTYISP